jgi:hypothetical protein
VGYTGKAVHGTVKITVIFYSVATLAIKGVKLLYSVVESDDRNLQSVPVV